jgi:hypothetical protein
MAYEFDLEGDVPDVSFVDNLGVQIVEFALGYDVESNSAIIMSVMLVPGASYWEDEIDEIYDLRFGIRTRDLTHEWRVSAPDYTKEAVEQFIPRDSRAGVLGHLFLALDTLVAHSQAKHLTMETYYPNLDDKALRKYVAICGFLKMKGFSINDEFRDETNGKNYWFLSRAD